MKIFINYYPENVSGKLCETLVQCSNFAQARFLMDEYKRDLKGRLVISQRATRNYYNSINQ